jgi:hypothetical protein
VNATLKVFIAVRHYQSSVTFADKAGAYQSVAPQYSTLIVASKRCSQIVD